MRIASLLRDVGEVGVAESILNKPSPLSQEEWRELERHPEIGARIVGAAQLGRVGEWILSHHERPDGSGYPRGLREHQIPLEARILAVADAYAAMTADRPYRRALLAEARQGRAPGAGRQPVRPRRGRGLPASSGRQAVRRARRSSRAPRGWRASRGSLPARAACRSGSASPAPRAPCPRGFAAPRRSRRSRSGTWRGEHCSRIRRLISAVSSSSSSSPSRRTTNSGIQPSVPGRGTSTTSASMTSGTACTAR